MAEVKDAEPIDVETLIAAPPAAVWAAIDEPDQRRRWWSYLDLEARPGGDLVERWRDRDGRERTTRGTVLEAEAPLRLMCTWRDEDWPAATEVELTLRPVGTGTAVRLRHRGWEALGGALRCAHASGWEVHLANLKRHVEGGASLGA